MGRRSRRWHRPGDPKRQPEVEEDGWVEWGGQLIWAAGFTAGGAPYGLTREELEEGCSPDDGFPADDGSDMSQRIKLGQNDKIPVALTPGQRDLILNQTFAGPALTESLRRAPMEGDKIVVRYTLSDIDELMGYVAAAANHSQNRQLVRELDRLHDYLGTFEERYEDELSAPR